MSCPWGMYATTGMMDNTEERDPVIPGPRCVTPGGLTYIECLDHANELVWQDPPGECIHNDIPELDTLPFVFGGGPALPPPINPPNK